MPHPLTLVTPEGDTPAPSRRRVLAASLFTAGYALVLSPPAESAVTTDDVGLTIEEPKIKAYGDFDLPAYVVRMAAAKAPGIRAGVAWYGRLAPPATPPAAGAPAPDPMPLQVVSEIKIPVLGLYGELDQGIPVKDVSAMRAALTAAGNTHCE